MVETFLNWAYANDVPFFVVFSTLIGVGFACMFAVAAALDLVVDLYRKFKSR